MAKYQKTVDIWALDSNERKALQAYRQANGLQRDVVASLKTRVSGAGLASRAMMLQSGSVT